MREIRYLSSAEEDFKNIFSFIFLKSYSVSVSEDFLESLKHKIDGLITFPHSGIKTETEWYGHELFYFPFDNYNAYYYFDEEKDIMVVVYVKNCNQNINSQLKYTRDYLSF